MAISDTGAVSPVHQLILMRVPKSSPASVNKGDQGETVDAALLDGLTESPPWYRLAYPDGDYVWTGFDPDETNKSEPESEASYDLAVQFFAAFAAIGMPCRHELVITNRRGFGSSGMRKKTQGTKAYIWIRADRVYRHVRALGGNGSLRQPHERRSYYRHEWLKSGIDRFKLPKDPVERAIFAEVNKVETTFVRACWVGPRRFPGGPNEDVEVN
jgi:hypothetical protein